MDRHFNAVFLGLILILIFGMESRVCGALLEVGPTYATIQAAIDNAEDGDVILIYPGYYYENLNPQGKVLWIRGKSGASTTIVRPKDSSQPTLQINHRESPALIFEGLRFEKAQSNAVQISRATATFVNCDFNGNEGEFGGAIASFGGTVIVMGCQFQENIARGKYPDGGALHARGGRVILSDTDLRRNQANLRGGALYGDGAKFLVESCTFFENDVVLDGRQKALGGGALYLQNGEMTCSRTYWLKNQTAERGGAWYLINSEVTAQNTIFARNLSVHQNGGAVYTAASKMRLFNDVFAENIAPEGAGGGIYTNRSPTSILNALFWQNEASIGFHIYVNGDSLNLDYSWGDHLLDGYAGQSPDDLHIGEAMIYEHTAFTQDSLGLYQLTSTSGSRNRGAVGPAWENPDGSRNTPGAYGGPYAGEMGAKPVLWDASAMDHFRKVYGQELTVWGQTVILGYIQTGFGNPTTALINQLGQQSTEAGFVDLATRQFQSVLKTSPDDPEALLGLAEIYDRTGYADLAKDAYDQAFRAHPENPHVALHQGMLSYQAGHWQDAIDYFTITVKSDTLNASAWMMFGRSALENGDFEQSKLALEEAIMCDSTLAEAYLWLAERADWLERVDIAMWWLSGAKNHIGPAHSEWLADEKHLEYTRKGKAFKALFPDFAQ